MHTKLPLTISALQDSILKRELSCTDMVDTYKARIDAYNKDLNIYLTPTFDQAYTKAHELDKAREELDTQTLLAKYPLFGIPVGYKDLFLTKGIRTTAASNVLSGYIPAYSATVVDRLERAGVLPLGKLNCDAWAHGSSGENSDFGPTKNPWNPKYTPGGSSSGSGAALAANMALVTTGTDTCGSIRLPANYCGVVGLKPTYGSVSRYGIVAMASSLDTVGHLANCVDDVARVFDVTHGPDGHDSTVVLHPPSDDKQATKLKVGVPKEFFQAGLSSEVEGNIKQVIDKLTASGVEVYDVSLPNTKYAIDVYYIVQPAEVSSNLGRYDGIRYGEGRGLFGVEAKRRIMLGTYVLSAGYYDAYYAKAMKVRTLIRQEIDTVFDQVDVLIAPVAPTPPFLLGEKVDDPLTMYLTDIYAATANLSGIPSLALPSGLTANGLPLGFQLMGPRFSENNLFNLGRHWEQLSGNHIYKPDQY